MKRHAFFNYFITIVTGVLVAIRAIPGLAEPASAADATRLKREQAQTLRYHEVKNGKWVAANEEIKPSAKGGTMALEGQHQGYFPYDDIYQGVIEMVTPEGQQLKSRPKVTGNNKPPKQPAPAQSYHVVKREAHGRVWERTTYDESPQGPVPRVHRYTELASGLHYWENDAWKESREEIEPRAGGAVARRGQHKVIFANNLATSGAIDLEMPDGMHLRSHVLGLSYFDQTTGKSVLIAEVKDCTGRIIAPNQVLYENAFTGLKASLRYTYTRGAFEQDVILEEQPPAPEEYGLNSKSTALQVLTEFVSPPEPRQKTLAAASGQTADEEVDFAAMKLAKGKAFSLPAGGPEAKPVSVKKEWLKIDGRTLLVETVPLSRIDSQLKTLPKRKDLRLADSNSGRHAASDRRRLPPAPPAARRAADTLMAKADASVQGFVLDYIILNTTFGDYTFEANTTYLISGGVTITNTATFEGGTVVKYESSPGNPGILHLYKVNCQTSPYRPAVFTSKDDDSVGEIIEGSSGVPTYVASPAFDFATDQETTLANIRITYADFAINYWPATAADVLHLRNVQIVHCYTGLYIDTANGEYCPFDIHNGLIADVDYVFTGYYYSGRAEHLTIVDGPVLASSDGNTIPFNFTNCVFANVDGIGYGFVLDGSTKNGFYNSVTFGTDQYSTTSWPFQSAGGGNYYLSTNSSFRNAGTTGIEPATLAEIRKQTTYPPYVCVNADFFSPIIFSPQAQRDTNAPDLGYHYEPLDYAFGGCTAYSNLTFTAGTAAGWFRTTSGWQHAGHGIHLADRQSATFNGTVTSPNYWVRLNTVQEEDATGGYGPGGITGWTDSGVTNTPKILGQFLRCSMMASESGNHFRDDWGYLSVQLSHSEFWSGGLGGYCLQLGMTNCLFDRCHLAGVSDCAPNLAFRNCTMNGATFSVEHWDDSAWPVYVEDCLFNGTTIYVDAGSNPALIHYDYNAFLQGADQLPGGTHNRIVSGSFNFQPGPLGRFYLPNNSPVIDQGSVTDAGLHGLHHFTTQVNQTKEGSSALDIGYHYVALDGAGQPIDSDSDGAPDYVEDLNGNGQTDGGEPPWSLRILTSPQSQTVVQGSNVTFSVIAAGALPLSYQWQFNGQNIPNAVNSTLVLNNVQLSQTGNYRVLVSNAYSSVLSSSAMLTVLPSSCSPDVGHPAITGSTFSFDITGLNGAGWNVYRSTDLAIWTLVSPVSGSSFTDTNITGVPHRFYRLSNGDCCSREMGFMRVTAHPGYTAMANPLVNANNTIAGLFSPMAGGVSVPSGTEVYKWRANGSGYDVYTNSAGAWYPHGNATFSPGEGFMFRNQSGAAFTVSFVGLVPQGLLTMLFTPGYTLIGAKVPQAGGITSLLGYTTPRDSDYVLRWNVPSQNWGGSWMYFEDWDPNDEYPAGWYNGEGILEEPTFQVGEAFFLYSTMTNSASRDLPACSGVVCVVPTATGPTNQSVCAGSTVTFSTAPSGTGPFTFVWKKGGAVLQTGSASLTLTNVSSTNAGIYCVEVGGLCGAVTNCATLFVNTTAAGPINQTAAPGSTVTFTTTPSGVGPFSYVWRKAGVILLTGSASFVLPNVSSSDVGVYCVEVTGACGSVTNCATLLPIAQVSGSATICSNSSCTIQAALTGTAPWTVVWSDGVTQSGAMSSPATRVVNPMVTTSYSVTSVSDAGGGGLSSGVAVVRVIPPPVITSQPADVTACPGSTVGFGVTASGAGGGAAYATATVGANQTPGDCPTCPVALSAQKATPPGDAVSFVDLSGPKGTIMPGPHKANPQAAKPEQKRADTILVKPKKQFARASMTPQHQKIRATVKRTFGRIGNLQVVKLPPGLTVEAALKHYRDSGLVEYAEPDQEVHAVLTPNDPQYGAMWSLPKISAPAAWSTRASADPIIVAVIDTGVAYQHPDLAANMWVNPNVNSPVNGVVYPNDVHGINAITGTGNPADDHFHGTHVAGTIGAVGNNAVGVSGVAWNVRIMALKFLGANGSGSLSDAIECIDYAVAKGAKVLNNSWGSPGFSQALHDAIAAARDAEVIFVAAAGNNSVNNDVGDFYPADYGSDLDNVVAVAATDQNDQLALFSNYGASSVGLAAPGVGILSTLPTTQTSAMISQGLPANYGSASGTSMASPHVAGAAAVVLAQYPSESYRQIILRLLNGTDPVPALNGRVLTGGRLDLLNALTQPPQPPFWLSYQWRKNGVNLPNQTGTSFSYGPITTNDNGAIFDMVITNLCGSVTSAPATLTVIIPCQVADRSPASVTQCEGNPVSLWVSTTGSEPISYRWRKTGNGWSNPWTLTSSGPGSGSIYIGSSTNNFQYAYNPSVPTDIDTAGKALGLNASGGHSTIVSRSLPTPMKPGGTLRIALDSGNTVPGGKAGFALYNAANQKWFEFYYTNNVYYQLCEAFPDPREVFFLGFVRHGIIIEINMEADNGMVFTMFAPEQNWMFLSIRGFGNIMQGPPDRIVLYNMSAGPGPANDVYFNNLAYLDNRHNGTGGDLVYDDNAVSDAYVDGWQDGDDGGTAPIPGATNSVYTVPVCTLADAGTYDVTVRNPCSSLVVSDFQVAVVSGCPGSPAAPSGLTATQLAVNQVQLLWTDNSSDETLFRIERAPDRHGAPGAWAQVATVSANSTSYVDTVTPHTVYWYRVRAHNDAGDSLDSNPVKFTPALAAPSDLTTMAASIDQVELSWTDNSIDETSFLIERAPNNAGVPGTWAQIASVSANSTSYVDTVAPDTIYWYRLRAHNDAGDSPYSNSAKFTSVPTAPSGLTPTAGSANQVALSWIDNSSVETLFLIERAPDNNGVPGTWAQIAMASANSTSYVDTIAPNTIYWYRVRAFNETMASAYSTAKFTPVPFAPSGLIATTVSANQASLSWTDNSSVETSFLIERAPDNAGAPGAWAQIGTASANSTSYVDSVAPDTVYWYRVRAHNDAGDSPYSGQVRYIPGLAAPSGLWVEPESETHLRLRWTDNSTAETSFRIERLYGGPTSTNTSWTQIGTVGANVTTYVDTVPNVNTIWWYRVRAHNNSGDSDYSNEARWMFEF